jgi:hypothetical protein
MADRCKAFFNGLEVQVSFSMTRSPGTSPDVGQLVWRRGGTLPSNFVGDLVLTNGDTEVVRFHDCMLRNPSERIGETRDIVYQIMDRRWKWKTPSLFGQYNVRDEANNLIDGHKKNARELALLALEAMHAPDGGTFDVSALPTDEDLAPHVVWHYEPAAVFLDKLCSMFGCTVHLLNDDSVKIIQDNTGDEPDNEGLMYPVETGLIINPAPDFATAYAGDTWFDGWLTTEPIGMELDGSVKPIAMLSFAPENGWKTGDPSHGYDSHIRGKLRGDVVDEMIDKTIELANRSLFRMYRVTGFPPGQLFFPGFTLENSVSSVSDLPEIGDPAKIYRIGSILDIALQRTAMWVDGAYVGITVKASFLNYALINPALIADLNADPVIVTANRSTLETMRINDGNPQLIIMEPGATAIDARILLPLMATRIESGLDEYGKQSRRSAECCGKFHESDYKLRNKTTASLCAWKRGLRVDTVKGHVLLNAPAYQRGADGVEPAELYLRCGYGFRQTPYGSRNHRQFNKASGNSLGIANATVNRTDVSEYRVQNYGSDYNDLSVIDTPITNTAAIDTILEQAATEYLKQYANLPAPKRKQYTPFRAINTNGKVMQVSYQGGVGQLGQTVAAIGGTFDLSMPPAKAKQLRDLQQRKAEFALQDFRVQQMNIGNQNEGITGSDGMSGIA